MAEENGTQRPSYDAYQVKKGKDEKSHFTKVGAAFAHKDGKGHTVSLDAVPVDGKIVLRSAKDRLQKHKSSERSKSQDFERD